MNPPTKKPKGYRRSFVLEQENRDYLIAEAERANRAPNWLVNFLLTSYRKARKHLPTK